MTRIKVWICLLMCSVIVMEYPMIDYAKGKVYGAMAVPPLVVSSETVLSLLISACAASGIYNSFKTQAEIEAMEEAERREYYNSIAVSDKELMKMVYDEGFFDGTGIEDLVQSAVYGSDAESAIDKFKAKMGLDNKDLFKVGGNKAPGENGKISAILASSVVALKNISDKLKSSALKWAEKIALANQTELVLPSALPSSGFPYDNYIVFTSLFYDELYSINNGVYCIMYHPSKDYASISTDSRGHWELQTRGWYLYVLINGEWVKKDGLPGSSSGYAFVDLDFINKGPVNIMYNNQTVKQGSNVWHKPTAYPTDTGGSPTEITPEEACAAVNEYISKLGYSTRLTADILTNENDVWAGTESNIDNWDSTTDKVLSIDDVVTTVRDMVLPISTAIENNKAVSADITTTLNDIRDKISEGQQTIVNSASKDLTAEDVTDLSGVPASGSLGSMNKYTFFGLEKVFPFCIPFDLIDFISVLDSEPVAPHFEWVIPLSAVGGKDLYFEIDLKPFDKVAEVVRLMELLSGCVGLILLTRNIIRG